MAPKAKLLLFAEGLHDQAGQGASLADHVERRFDPLWGCKANTRGRIYHSGFLKIMKDLCITIKDSLDLLDLVLFWEISGGF